MTLAGLRPGEDEELEKQYKKMSSGRNILEAMAAVKGYTGNDNGAQDLVGRAVQDTYIDQTVRRFQEERYRKGKRMIPVAVNLSRMDLMNSRLMERICTELQETKVPKQYFRYEIIESAYTIIDKQGEEFLESLRREGVQIFLDDFGTGISTFETVRDYTFDALKIDMGFVKKIGKNPKSDAIVISIIDMAHRMGMKVVAEGIENKQQSEFLCNHGCDYLQGYYYYKPMSAEEFSKLLDK